MVLFMVASRRSGCERVLLLLFVCGAVLTSDDFAGEGLFDVSVRVISETVHCDLISTPSQMRV